MYLELRSHIFDHQPEDFAANIKYSIHRTGTIAGDAETQVKFDGLKKTRRLVALGVFDSTKRGSEDSDVIVQETVN